ncbi:MAG TPA: hypothetical protein VL945_00535 [Candidatus Saccharimonadales bacterium]|nr:hypothetical protein [Candidatus Saccharimonadales bacterium]
MAKSAKMDKIWGVLGFEFVGSIFFLSVALTAGLTWTGSWQWWQTILFGVGLVGSVSLFFMCFGNFGLMKRISMTIMKTAMVTAVALVAISAGDWPLIGLTLVGFILTFMGASWGMPKEW